GSGALLDPATFQFILGPTGFAQSGAPVNVTSGAAVASGIDFGFNFDTIVNVNPFGAGSLKQFLMNASRLGNARLAPEGFAPGTQRAIFMISNGSNAPGLRAANNYFANGVATILQDAELPLLSESVVVDATLQPGYTGRPIVALNGANAGITNGLTILSPDCEIRGLIIGAYDGSAISVEDVNANIAGCWLGVDPSGSGAWANHADGITVWANGAVIGGGTPADRNVLSGNGGHGVLVEFTASAAQILGNYVGTDVTGSAALPNATASPIASGVRVDGDNCIVGGAAPGERNVISGNQGAGAILSGFANRLAGNWIGVDAGGTGALGNTGNGVLVSADFGGSGLAIGGPSPGDGNLIANNGGSRIAAAPSAGHGNAM